MAKYSGLAKREPRDARSHNRSRNLPRLHKYWKSEFVNAELGKEGWETYLVAMLKLW